MVDMTLKMVNRISAKDLLDMKEMDEKLSISMHFYNIMGTAAYFGKHEMIHFVACRMVWLTMKNGLCKHSILGFVQFSGVIFRAKKCAESASRIGKAAMSCCRERYNTHDMVPNLYATYYGFIAPYTEPLQTCADMLRQGFDAGISLGETGTAFFNASLHIRTAMMAGERLPTLMEQVDYYLELINAYQNEIAKPYLSIFRGTISILIDNGESTSSARHAIDVPTNTTNANMLETIFFHSAIQAYWQGHNERCQYWINKFLLHTTPDISDMCRFQFITFTQGLNSFQLPISKISIKFRTTLKKAIRVLNTAASYSSWNFCNKVRCNQSFFDALGVLFDT